MFRKHSPVFRRFAKRFGREQGFTILESLISLSVMGIVVVALLSTLSTVSSSISRTGSRGTAKNIAEVQMELIKGQAYAASYLPMELPANEGYQLSIETAPLQDMNIQKISVLVKRNNIIVARLEDYRVN